VFTVHGHIPHILHGCSESRSSKPGIWITWLCSVLPVLAPVACSQSARNRSALAAHRHTCPCRPFRQRFRLERHLQPCLSSTVPEAGRGEAMPSHHSVCFVCQPLPLLPPSRRPLGELPGRCLVRCTHRDQQTLLAICTEEQIVPDAVLGSFPCDFLLFYARLRL